MLGSDLLEFPLKILSGAQCFFNSSVSYRKDCGDGDKDDSQADRKGCKQGGY